MSYVGEGDFGSRANADSLVECARLLAEQRVKDSVVQFTEPVIVRRYNEHGASWLLYVTQADADRDASLGTNPTRAYGFIRCLGAVTPGTITAAEIAELRALLADLMRDCDGLAAFIVRGLPRDVARIAHAFNALISTNEIS